MFYIIFTPLTTMGYALHCRLRIRFTLLFTFPTRPRLKLIPMPSRLVHHQSPLTSYSDACWGSQIGSAVRDGTLLPLFKCRSMSGGIIFCQGRPITWTAVRQECTSLSLCKAEIAQQMKSPNCKWGFDISPMMFGQMVTSLSTWRRLLLLIMTTNCASSGLTTCLQNRFATWKCRCSL
jgi:hypothetical protein